MSSAHSALSDLATRVLFSARSQLMRGWSELVLGAVRGTKWGKSLRCDALGTFPICKFPFTS